MSLMSYDEALARVLAIAPLGRVEPVALGAAHGRVLAADLVARRAAPRHPVSTMDGYAIAAGAITGSALRVIGESRPGRGFDGAVGEGEAVRVFTGARMPAGGERVVMQEHARRDGDAVWVTFAADAPRFWRAAASDFAAGAVLLEAGTRLGARALVAAAAADAAELSVAAQPKVAIIATGDELAAPGSDKGAGDTVPDSLSAALAAFVSDAGGCVVAAKRCGDRLEALREAAAEALAAADLVIVTGGASVGAHDHARAMFGDALTLLVDKVAIKPGKPVWLGRSGARLVLGLPGNPTSALVTAALFARPLLARLQGAAGAPVWRELPLAAPLARTGEREGFVRARWDRDGLVPLDNQDSGAQAPLAEADWLIRCPPAQPAQPSGSPVTALAF